MTVCLGLPRVALSALFFRFPIIVWDEPLERASLCMCGLVCPALTVSAVFIAAWFHLSLHTRAFFGAGSL